MLTKTQPKEISLDQLIARLQQKLIDAGFNIVKLQPYLIHNINMWSVELKDNDCSLLCVNGQGVSPKIAIVNALEKFIQRISTHDFWTEWYFGDSFLKNKFVHHPREKWFKKSDCGSWPNNILNDELQRFYDPVGELNPNNLIDINSSNSEWGICCLPYTCVRTGEQFNFPINIVSNLYSNNGMSSANTLEDAQLNGLTDIIKNYIRFEVIAQGICLPNIPKEVLNHYPHILENINKIETAGFSLLIQDASLGGKYPVLAILLLNSENQDVAISFGAHPKFEIALEQAFQELLQRQSLNINDEYAEAGFDSDEIAGSQNLAKHFNGSKGNTLKNIDSNGIVAWGVLKNKSDYEFVDWGEQTRKSNDNQSSKEEYKQLCDLVHAEGNDVFVFDHKTLGLYACNIIVPGMSEVYPIDDLVWENNNIGMHVRDLILKQNKTEEDCEQLIIKLEDLGQNDEYLISTLIGMPSDPNSIFEDLTMNELITLLAFKTQDNERIQEGCEWLLHYKKIKPYRLKIYHCINSILQLESMTHYSQALQNLYTKSILNDALALIDGEDVFPLASDWNMHKSLIDAYKKVINLT